jgi:hypothetical protein
MFGSRIGLGAEVNIFPAEIYIAYQSLNLSIIMILIFRRVKGRVRVPYITCRFEKRRIQISKLETTRIRIPKNVILDQQDCQ